MCIDTIGCTACCLCIRATAEASGHVRIRNYRHEVMTAHQTYWDGICMFGYPVVVNSWVHFAYAAHMRHMTYAAYDICGAHMRDICGICRLGLNNPSRKSMVFQIKRKIVCESRCQDRRKKRICGDICGAYAAYVICPHCC